MKFSVEKMSDEFTKYHVRGLPFDAVIHHFTGRDIGDPHDHPFAFTSHILSGGYVERVYSIEADGTWRNELVTRLPGTVHRIEAGHIHEIVELLSHECYTLIIPEEKVRESRFWKFEETGIKSRAWHEPEYKSHESSESKQQIEI